MILVVIKFESSIGECLVGFRLRMLIILSLGIGPVYSDASDSVLEGCPLALSKVSAPLVILSLLLDLLVVLVSGLMRVKWLNCSESCRFFIFIHGFDDHMILLRCGILNTGLILRTNDCYLWFVHVVVQILLGFVSQMVFLVSLYTYFVYFLNLIICVSLPILLAKISNIYQKAK